MLEGTDDWVLWIFKIFSFPTFSKPRNPFLAVSQSYHVRVTSKIQVNFWFHRCSRVLMIGSYGFLKFFPYSKPTVFEGSTGIHFWQSYGFSKFLNSLRFRGQGVHVVSQSYYVWVTSKIQINFPFTGTQGYWWLGLMEISSFPTFSRSKNFFRSFSYHVRKTLKIQVNFRFHRCSRVLMIVSHGFS